MTLENLVLPEVVCTKKGVRTSKGIHYPTIHNCQKNEEIYVCVCMYTCAHVSNTL
jgi:hypothetical protein